MYEVTGLNNIVAQRRAASSESEFFTARCGKLFVGVRELDPELLTPHFETLTKVVNLAVELRSEHIDVICLHRLLRDQLLRVTGSEPELPQPIQLTAERFAPLPRRFSILRDALADNPVARLDGNQKEPVAHVISDLLSITGEAQSALVITDFCQVHGRASAVFHRLGPSLAPVVQCLERVLGKLQDLTVLFEFGSDLTATRSALKEIMAVLCPEQIRFTSGPLPEAHECRLIARCLEGMGINVQPDRACEYIDDFRKWINAVIAVSIDGSIRVIRNSLCATGITPVEHSVSAPDEFSSALSYSEHYAGVLRNALSTKVWLGSFFRLASPLTKISYDWFEEIVCPPWDRGKHLTAERLDLAESEIRRWRSSLGEFRRIEGSELLSLARVVDASLQLCQAGAVLQPTIDVFMGSSAIRLPLAIPGLRQMLRYASEIRFAERFRSSNGHGSNGTPYAALDTAVANLGKIAQALGDGRLLREGLPKRPEWLV